MTDNNRFYRSFGLDRAKIDDEARTVSLVFSTETPVERWMGAEILLHGPENVNFERFERTGAGLCNHNPDRIIGPIREFSIDNFRGVAVLGFDDDEVGNMAWGKVRSGSLRGVSVGYDIQEGVELRKKEEFEARPGFVIRGPALVGTLWTPGELSLTPVPRDINSGVARSRSLEGIRIKNVEITTVGEDHPDWIKYRLQKQGYRGYHG